MKRKVLSIALVFCLVISLFASFSLQTAALDNGLDSINAGLNIESVASDLPETPESSFQYIISDGEATIIYFIGYETEVVIPAEIGGCPVVTIGGWAFLGCKSVTLIVIPNSVKTICWGAFSNCTGLLSINIPDSVTTIGEDAFQACSSLTTMTVPNSVTSIGKGAFNACTGLTSMTLPFIGGSASETQSASTLFGYIFGTAYYDGGYLITQTFSSINRVCYCVPSSLKEVTITGNKVLFGAFQGCKELTSINILSSQPKIDNYVFSGCSSLTSLNMQTSATSIGAEAFSGCSSLTSIEIPDSVTDIARGAFQGCSSLISINIPNGVTEISNSLFSGCSSLTSIIIPEKVTIIYPFAFEDCSNLTSVTLPDSLESIPDYAFRGCSSLTTIKIPDSVKTIDDFAFENCSSLVSISFPDSTTLGGGLFVNCSNLTSVTLPDSLENIPEYAFKGCSSLTTINIPDSVKTIDIFAFQNCSSLVSISFPDSTTLGGGLFVDCSSLKTITLPNSLTSIDYWMFKNCSSLTSITIPDNVTSIKWNSFANCTSLTSLKIPKGVTSIDKLAFANCSSLKLVYGYTDYVENYFAANFSGVDYVAINESTNAPYAPSAPTVLTKTSMSVTVQPVLGCEYSIDGENWQNSNIFENLKSGTNYTFYARYAETETTYASEKSAGLTIKTEPAITVKITGEAYYGKTVSAAVSNALNGVALTYQWLLDGVEVGTASTKNTTYKIYIASLGKKLSVRVTSPDGSLNITSEPVTLLKALQNAPASPAFASKTDTTVTLEAVPGREFSCDYGATWQASNVFTGLMQNTTYTFYARRAETIGSSASEMSATGLMVRTDETAADIVANLVGTGEYDTVLTVDIAGAPEGATIAYKWYLDGVALSTSAASYTVYSSAFGKLVYCDVTINGQTTVRTGGIFGKMAVQTPPAPPVFVARTTTSIEVNTVLGVEYSIDNGATWQSSGLFENLKPGTVYTVYNRRPGRGFYTASIARKLKAITAVEASDFTVTISGSGKYTTALTAEISGIDLTGKTVTYQWQRGDIAVGGNTNSYTCYYADIDKDITVTVIVDGKVAVSNKIVGAKGDQAGCNAPVLSSKTSSSITVAAVAGKEYSIDGINWQSSNEFTGLQANTTYKIYMRRGESRAYLPGAASKPLTVTTIV